MWNTLDTMPDVGRRFIGLFDDGSGARMYWRHDGGFIDHEGDERDALPNYIDRWAYLPDELEFWCEIRSEDPMSLFVPQRERLSGSGVEMIDNMTEAQFNADRSDEKAIVGKSRSALSQE